MSDMSEGEQFNKRFSDHDKEEALMVLDHFEKDDHDYYVIYQKDNQAVKELQFNQVKKTADNSYLIKMYHEDVYDSVCYYCGEEVVLTSDEIVKVRIVEPDEYDFVVYTD